jgi:hypothetical protein
MQSCRCGSLYALCRGAPSTGAQEMKPSKALGTLGKVAPVMMLLLAFCASCPAQAIARHMPPRCIGTPPYDTYRVHTFYS